MKRNPIRSRAAIDSAPCSHPREAPRRGFREQVASKVETILLDARIQKELGPLDYALCRARDTGGTWSEIAALLEQHLGGRWSPQRAASRTRRAQANLDCVLARIRDLETAETRTEGQSETRPEARHGVPTAQEMPDTEVKR